MHVSQPRGDHRPPARPWQRRIGGAIACAAPPPAALQLRDAFPTLYEGRIQPAVASAAAPTELASMAIATAEAIDDGAASAAMRAWLV